MAGVFHCRRSRLRREAKRSYRMRDDSWADATADVDFVLHIANEDDLILPARGCEARRSHLGVSRRELGSQAQRPHVHRERLHAVTPGRASDFAKDREERADHLRTNHARATRADSRALRNKIGIYISIIG